MNNRYRSLAAFFKVLFILLSIVSFKSNAFEKLEHEVFDLIDSSDGTKIATYEYGNPNGTELLFIHGFSQSNLSWSKQVNSEMLSHARIITIDLRGHGASDKPIGDNYYNNSKVWAQDIKAVIENKKLKKPVLVGWSYGGIIINDYLDNYGDKSLGGIVFVGAGIHTGTPSSLKYYGEGARWFEGMLSNNVSKNIVASQRFLESSSASPLLRSEFEVALSYTMMVPPRIRAAMASRVITDNEINSTFSKVNVSTFIMHGKKDNVVLPKSSDYIAEQIPGSKTYLYQESGHLLFIEESDRFNKDLKAILGEIKNKNT